MVSALKLVRKAVDAIKLGAYDYITKPYEPEDILSTVNRVISQQRLHKEVDFLRRRLKNWAGQIVSQNKTMLQTFDLIKRLLIPPPTC
jgi:DNA-binding NtrC family response regulator